MARGGTTRIAGIVVDFVANTLGYDASLKKSGDVTSRWSRGVEQSFSRASKKIDGFVSSAFSMRNVVGALVGGGGLGYLAKQSLDLADEIGDTAEKLGITTDFLQEMRHAAVIAGADVESVARSLGLFNRNIAEAATTNKQLAQLFSDLGVEIKNADGSLRSTRDIFLDVVEVFPRLQEGAARTGVAMDLFGRSGGELVPLLSRGREEMARLMQQAHDLGLTLSGEATQAAGALTDTFATFYTSMRNAATEGLIEGLTSELGDMNDAMGQSEASIKAMHDALKSFVQTIVENADLIALVGGALYGYKKGKIPGAMVGGWLGLVAAQKVGYELTPKAGDLPVGPQIPDDIARERGIATTNAAAAATDRLTVSTEKATKAKAAAKTEQEKHDEAVEKFTASLALEVRALEIEAAAIGLGEEARREALIQRDLEVALAKEGIAAGTEEARVIEELIRKRSALNAEIDATKTATEEATDAGERFTSAYEATGQTIGTAFEDAIIEGEKLGDVLESLLKDLQRIALRTLITGPLETALAGTLKDIIPFGKTAALTAGVAAPEMAAPQVNVYTQPGETARVSSRQGTGGSQLDIVIEAVESRLAQRTVTGRGIRAPLAVLMRGPEG